MRAIVFHHPLDVDLLAVVFFAGHVDPHFKGLGILKIRAGWHRGALDLGGVLGFQILESDHICGVCLAEEGDAIESFGSDGLEGQGFERGVVDQPGL
jgi:hypothetical protein